MKKLFIIFTIIFSANAFAQEQTLVSGKLESGGYGAPVIKFSSVNKSFALFVGGYGGWLINHTFMIGGGGYGLVNNINFPQGPVLDYYYVPLERKIQFGYGGLMLEYIGNYEKLVHYSFSVLIGAGGITYGYRDFEYNSDYPVNSVFVLEPAVNLEINITTFFRIDCGAGYRLVTGVNMYGLKNADMGGPSLNLAFKFGKF